MEIGDLLTVMVQRGASDLYLTAEAAPMLRVQGIVEPIGQQMIEADEAEALARSIMTDKQLNEFQATNEQNFGLHMPALGRFRVSVFRQRAAVAMVIRQIRSFIPSVRSLNLPPVLEDVMLSKRGLVLVVGATGSGKSTTLAAMIDHRATSQCGHIMTVEDPIEFVFPHRKAIVSQREVGLDTDSYHIALKNALRQAPDVIMIGEIRDSETMQAALSFAETGHLCLATLHSTSTTQTFERILSFFPREQEVQVLLQLSLNLRATIGQRLVRGSDGSRVPAVEVLLDSPRIKELISKGEFAEIREVIEKSTTLGMQTFDQALFDLYKRNIITLDEALRNADSQNNLRLKIKLEEQGQNKTLADVAGKTGGIALRSS